MMCFGVRDQHCQECGREGGRDGVEGVGVEQYAVLRCEGCQCTAGATCFESIAQKGLGFDPFRRGWGDVRGLGKSWGIFFSCFSVVVKQLAVLGACPSQGLPSV